MQLLKTYFIEWKKQSRAYLQSIETHHPIIFHLPPSGNLGEFKANITDVQQGKAQ